MSADDRDRARTAALQTVLEHVEAAQPLLVLKAPPGSGKTYVTLRAVALAAHRGRRVAVAAQTNAQADDLCVRMAEEFPRFTVFRWASSGRTPRDLGRSVRWITRGAEIPEGPCVVVATTAKWSASDPSDEPFHTLFVDEAWQMCWADFMLMGAVAARFVLVGDPGQIAPVVPIDVSRWQTTRRPPHVPAPEVVLRDATLPTRVVALPVSTRLAADTCAMVKAFYDFDFTAWSEPGARRLGFAQPGTDAPDGVDAALDLLADGSLALLTLPTPDDAPVQHEDPALAEAIAHVVARLLARETTVYTEQGARPLVADDVGVTATHRVMNTRIRAALDVLGAAGRRVRVDTPERWQGLERAVMVAAHPLSGMTDPSAFDLGTGRLCVMTSRHRVALVLVSRDHVGDTLTRYLPAATQSVGLPDAAGQGRAMNLRVWQHLHHTGRVVAARMA